MDLKASPESQAPRRGCILLYRVPGAGALTDKLLIEQILPSLLDLPR
jgi:hypothetical protein